MKRFWNFTKQFIRSQDGATLVEYGLLIALLAIVAIGAIVSLAGRVHGVFDKAQAEMANGGIPSK